MNFETKYDIYAEARAVLNMRSPLETFEPADIGTFVLAWSSKEASTPIRGTLMSFGCDSDGEYVMVKQWLTNVTARYTMVAPLPSSMLPTKKIESKTGVLRDPDVKVPEMPL